MAPKSMSSEKKNIELKSKEKNNTDKLNLSGQIVRILINHSFLTTYKSPDKRAGQIQFVRVFFNSKIIYQFVFRILSNTLCIYRK